MKAKDESLLPTFLPELRHLQILLQKKKDPEHLDNNFTSQKGLVSTKELTLPKSRTYGWITKLNQYLLSFSSCVCTYCKNWNWLVKNDKPWCYLFESPTLLEFHNWFESLSAKNSNFLSKFWNISWSLKLTCLQTFIG